MTKQLQILQRIKIERRNNMIKKFNEFILETKSGKLYDYGCVMIYPTVEDWKDIISIINPNDIYQSSDTTYGIEKNPHITLLYGLHPEVSEEHIGEIINKFKGKDLDINVNGIGKFDNIDFSVVKFNIESPILHEINKELTNLPHTTDYPDYKPHMTIAYVKPGSADKYLKGDYRRKFENIDKVAYSMTDGSKVDYSI